MANTDHLAALSTRLSNERARLAQARTPKEREARAVFVAQCEKEVADEMRFLGMDPAAPDIDDDDLLRELTS